MKRTVMITVLVFQSLFCLSQSDSTFQKIIIPKLSINSIVNFLTPTIEAGLEVRFTKCFSYGSALGIQISDRQTSEMSNQHYTKYKNELRYYPPSEQSKKARPYIGLEWLNFTRTYSKKSSTFHQDDMVVSYGYADVKRKINAGSVIFGCQFGKRKFTTDVFLGIGLRFRNIQYSNVSATNSNEGDDTFTIRFHDSDYRAGKFYTVNIPFSVRVGYQIPFGNKE